MHLFHRSIRTLLPLAAMLVFALSACTAPTNEAPAAVASAAAGTHDRELARENANRALVIDFYNSFFNDHRVHEAAAVVDPSYVQHNPDVPDGKAPFVDFYEGFFREHPRSRARIVRSAADGDLVYLHVHSTNDADDRGQAVMDIFRLQDGRIVEHWDVVQDVPAEAANGNTMF